MPRKDENIAAHDVDILRRIEDTMLNDPSLMREAKVIEGLDMRKSEIKKFISGRSILITGGTGFLGKALLEKLLRACPTLDTIYVIIRNKKEKDMHTRLAQTLDDPVFQVVAKEQPKFRHKVVPIQGDVSMPNLGLSNEDRELIINKVSMIFHMAATIRFDETLKTATKINVVGTTEMLALAKQCRHLKSFVHVSTAYANCTQGKIREEIYSAPISTKDIVNIINSKSDEELAQMTPGLIGTFPNTYAYTKAIAEDTVRELGKGLPVCVYRPSIVVASYREPVRGWADNLAGATGVIVGAGMGLLHTLHCDKDKIADLVPIDMVVNSLIACAWYTATSDHNKSTDEIPVYNYVSSNQSPITWGRFCDLNRQYGIEVPTIHSIYYYSFQLHKNWYVHVFYAFFCHWLKALIYDAAALLVGQKPRLIKIYKKILKFSDVITYFTTKQWEFSNENVINLWSKLNETDKYLFNFDMDQLDWDIHSQTHIMGLRVYLVKDDASTLPQAKIRWQRMKMAHQILKFVVGLIFLRLLWSVLSCAMGFVM